MTQKHDTKMRVLQSWHSYKLIAEQTFQSLQVGQLTCKTVKMHL